LTNCLWVLKVETGRAVILVIMYVEIFQTGVIVFIGEVKICLRSHCPIIFNIRTSSLACELRTDLIFKVNLVIQTISCTHQRQFVNKSPSRNTGLDERPWIKTLEKSFSKIYFRYNVWPINKININHIQNVVKLVFNSHYWNKEIWHHGTCKEGVCQCDNNWRGLSCNHLSCQDQCSNHGTCTNGIKLLFFCIVVFILVFGGHISCTVEFLVIRTERKRKKINNIYPRWKTLN
jgi:hypothetical protein